MKPGEYLEIQTKEGDIFNGLVMPSSNKSTICLKLNSGYNLNLDNKKISKMKNLEKEIKIEKETNAKQIINPNLKTITILHTGGTLASKVSYATGAVTPSFKPEELLEMFPELKEIANIKSRLIGNMFSEDMRFSHYNLIAKEIEKEIKEGVDGVIITHGTDTLAFTSCALSFALENLDKPVILVGAQRSSDRPSSDAAFNLICAANFIVKSNFNEVGICIHGKSGDDFCYILPATKTRKMHTSRRDAFKSVNGEIIAKVDKVNMEFFMDYKKKEHKDKLKLKLFNEKIKIGILKAHPNMFAFEIKYYNKFDGLILEGTGLGHFPINFVDNTTKEHQLIYNELKKLCKKIPVIATSQCIFGRINMNVYETGRKMQEAGILGNLSDMTAETAFIKLVWLLSNYKKNEINNLVMHNFRNELNDKLKYEEEFI